MKAAVIDVIDWQISVDLKTARPIECQHPTLGVARELAASRPFPGDLELQSIEWATDMGLDVLKRFEPRFMSFIYATPFFFSTYTSISEADHRSIVDRVFANIDRFVAESGFTPVVVGLGDMTPVVDTIDLAGLDGLGVGSHNSPFGGVYGASEVDLRTLGSHPGIGRIVSREEFRQQFAGTELFYRRFPDHLLIAQPGYRFRGAGSNARPVYQIPLSETTIPLSTTLGPAKSIADIAGLVLKALEKDGQRVALFLIEGVGIKTFSRPFTPLDNSCQWFQYSLSEAQYLAVTTGRHLMETDYPPACLYYLEDGENKDYPLSGMFNALPEDTIARRFAGKSAAIANRGMWPHAVNNADVTVEPFARNIYNHGCMVVVDLQRLSGV